MSQEQFKNYKVLKTKLITLFLLLLVTISYCQKKYDDLEIAKKEAEVSNKNILIILTGSDWCKPCIKMEKNVIENNEFIEYANQNLILFEINLPRHLDYDSKIVKNYIYLRDNIKPTLYLH